MRNSSVKDMDSVNAFFNGINAVFQLRNHTSAYITVIDQFLCFIYMKFRDQAGGIILVFINSFNIRKECKLLSMNSLCNGTCRIIRINIISSELIVITYRENNRQEIFLQKIFQDLRLNLCNFAYLTVQNYRRDVTNFLEWLDVPEADFDPRRITVEDVREWIVHRTETKHLGAASMNRELSSLRSFFRYLHRTGRIDKEVMYRIHALKTSRRIPAFVPSTRMEGILDELDRESESPEFKFVRNSLIVLLFYSCGLRLAELVGIDRDDFSGDYTALKVRGKGDKERIVPILPPVREKILHYLDEIDRQGICISKEKALFLNQQGKRISRSTVYRTVQSQLRQGGVQGKKSPHVLRHTFATELLNNGADMRAIQELLGHASLQATQVYTHNSIAKLQEIYSKAHPREKNGAEQTKQQN